MDALAVCEVEGGEGRDSEPGPEPEGRTGAGAVTLDLGEEGPACFGRVYFPPVLVRPDRRLLV